MKISALLTSAGINITLCVLLLSLYSVLRKQPGNICVYFGRRLAEDRKKHHAFSLERLVPSPGWIKTAWKYTENDIVSVAGLDALVFIRIIVFSIRIFSIASIICVFVVLPCNYFGKDGPHAYIPSESLGSFTIANVKEGSSWLWIHCTSLYIISCSACILLYFEYKHITRMRLAHFIGAPHNPGHFTVLVRAIPKSSKESFSDSVESFFTKYHASTYLCHQMIHRAGKIQKIMRNAEKVCEKVGNIKDAVGEQRGRLTEIRCCLCRGTSDSFHIYRDLELDVKNHDTDHLESSQQEKECSAAFVFFKTRYAAVVASKVMQTSNPMTWVTDLAPEPQDVYWSNLWIPYTQLWIRRIATLLAAIVFMFLFLIPVTFIQGLTQLDQLQQRLPFLRGILKRPAISEVVTGYLPSVILMLFLYTVPLIMMRFSSAEGPISRSARKKSACCKILYFYIWNVFFVNVLSGSVISQLNVFFNPKDIPIQLAKAVPRQATFFITYVLTSGWASLSSEVMQPFPLIINFVRRYLLRRKVDRDFVPSFPYQTEVPRVLLFGLLGFTCSVLAPLILPILLIYFLLGYIVYRNQIINVYSSKYDTGGLMWPIVHNTMIFSLILAQIITLGVLGLKEKPVASGFVVPLVILTLLFNEYCRKRFYPVFKNISAQDIIDMDLEDEQNGRMEEIYMQLQSAYLQSQLNKGDDEEVDGEGTKPSETGECSTQETKSPLHLTLGGLPTSTLQRTITSLSMVIIHPRRAQSV